MNNTLHNRQFPLGIIHNDDKLIVITSQGTHYATTYDPSAARLISAAPDLLSALEGFIELYEQGQLKLEGDRGSDPLILKSINAIAKAEGRVK
jgi:hypothetical protein